MGSKLEIPENLILSDMNTLNALYGYSKGNSQYTSAVFNTNKNVDDVISDVNKIQENWSLYNISKSDDTFLALSKSFDSLEKIVNMLLIGSIIVGIIVLSLVLAFWIQGRIHETGNMETGWFQTGYPWRAHLLYAGRASGCERNPFLKNRTAAWRTEEEPF